MGRIAWPVGVATAVAVALSTWFIAGWGGESTLRIACNLGCLAFAIFATV
ncbi:MAG: hypothetical protein QOE04_3049, partial [Mycobacterium sp.]|nr:hypothetical protein [Mycobacterium sp.]